jgi:fructose-1-phosphate kinase PfkB-like protein
MVKPNRDEISELVGYPVINLEAAGAAVIALREQGITMPAITMGELGAIAVDDSGVWHARLDVKQERNAVGSGDCFLAGMAVAIQRHMPLEHALRLGVACGAANAMHEETGYVRRAEVDALLPRVRLARIGS